MTSRPVPKRYSGNVRKSPRLAGAVPAPKGPEICPHPAPDDGTALQLPLSLLSPS